MFNELIHDTNKHQFRIESEGQAALLNYHKQPGKIIFLHTEVPPAWEGRGIGSRLAKAGLEYARARNLQVVPLCPFVAAYLEQHPEYADLVHNAAE